MKIWLLEVINTDKAKEISANDKNAEYFGDWTSVKGYVVIAADEKAARTLCADTTSPWWLDADASSCEEVLPSGKPRVVLANEPTG